MKMVKPNILWFYTYLSKTLNLTVCVMMTRGDNCGVSEMHSINIQYTSLRWRLCQVYSFARVKPIWIKRYILNVTKNNVVIDSWHTDAEIASIFQLRVVFNSFHNLTPYTEQATSHRDFKISCLLKIPRFKAKGMLTGWRILLMTGDTDV